MSKEPQTKWLQFDAAQKDTSVEETAREGGIEMEGQCCIVLLEARARELMVCGEPKGEAKASARIVRKAHRPKGRPVTRIRLEAEVN